MKKQWILIGTLAVVVAITGAIFGLNRGAGETAQGAVSWQGPTPEQIERDKIAQEFAAMVVQYPTLEQIERDKIAQEFAAMAISVSTGAVQGIVSWQGLTPEQIERDKVAQEFAAMAVQDSTDK
jgi:ABC-type phosphate transport system permease subunit